MPRARKEKSPPQAVSDALSRVPDPDLPERPEGLTAEDIVADAQIFGWAHLAQNYDFEKRYFQRVDPDETHAQKLERWTAGLCFRTSARSLFFLSLYPDLLEDTFLLRSQINFHNVEESRFTGNYFRHTVWVVESKSGEWFIGSPSNYQVPSEDSRKSNPLTIIHRSHSLEDALQQLTLHEGGVWPSAQDIIQRRSHRELAKIIDIRQPQSQKGYSQEDCLFLSVDAMARGAETVQGNRGDFDFFRFQVDSVEAYLEKDGEVPEISESRFRIRCVPADLRDF